MDKILEIKNLSVQIEGKEILKNLSLSIEKGSVVAIMGPNGSGKSTLAKVLAGHPAYEVTGGEVLFQGENLLGLEPEERAQKGLFLGFQYPVEVSGVSNRLFLRFSLNAIRKAKGLDPYSDAEFETLLDAKMGAMEIRPEFKERGLNEGFSGGEKKRNEILQMALLEPTLAILDETDSGLDIDAIRIVAQGVNAMRKGERAFLLITHYQRLLDFIRPDWVHVLSEGKILRTGGAELALELEEKGYR